MTLADIQLAARENYASVEHLKRYTTLGMATDQGKTSNVNGLIALAKATGRTPAEVGTTRFRPPYTPVSFAALAGARRGELLVPRKWLPAHFWHQSIGAVFEDYGWQRPDGYPQPGETIEAAAQREARAVRQGVGLFDASPLGKIEVRGTDAGRLLDFLYTGRMSNLAPGRIRYGMMLNERGTLIDDGVVVCVAPDTFLLHPSSSAADAVAAALDEWLQCEFCDWDVTVINVTQQWATATLSGPDANAIIARILPGLEALPHMHFRETQLGEVPVRVARVSFTGEPSFEISTPARYGKSLFEQLGAIAELVPFGIEALELLRIEKGYLHIGTDTDGTTMPHDVSAKDFLKRGDDFVGRRSLLTAAARDPARLQLVGLEPADPVAPGAHILTEGRATQKSAGFVTSACISPMRGRPIALALLQSGRARFGQTVMIEDLGRRTAARIVEPVFFDPAGERLHA